MQRNIHGFYGDIFSLTVPTRTRYDSLTPAVEARPRAAYAFHPTEQISLPIDRTTANNDHRLAVMEKSRKAPNSTQLSQCTNSVTAEMLVNCVTPELIVAVLQEQLPICICPLPVTLPIRILYVPLNLRHPILRLAAIAEASRAAVVRAQTVTVQAAPVTGASNATIADFLGFSKSLAP